MKAALSAMSWVVLVGAHALDPGVPPARAQVHGADEVAGAAIPAAVPVADRSQIVAQVVAAIAAETPMEAAPAPAPCTAGDLEGVRDELREVRAVQARLAEIVAARLPEPPESEWRLSLSARQALVWLGVGGILGWAFSAAYARRREGRQRNRLRF
jgi:hypothetical protein